MSRKYIELEKNVSDREELEKLTLGALRRAVFEGDMDFGSVMSGQIAGLIKEEKTLKEIFKDMILDSRKQFISLQNKLGELNEY